MRVKHILTVVLPLVLLLSVSGCDNPNSPIPVNSVPDLSSPVNLKFINSWGGSDPKAETLQSIFNAFSKDNPGITISNESLYGDDFLIKLKTDFASGNDPDVFGLWPGSDIKALVAAGKVADITDVLEADPEWKSTFDPKMWYNTTFDNKIYGLPVEIIFEGLYVNTDLFEKNDIQIPQNYEELKEAVTRFRSVGIIPIAFNCRAEGTYLYQNIAMMIGGKEAIENPISEGQINPCYIKAMNVMKELYEMGAFPDNVFTMSSVERNDLFIQKKAAMIVQGSWFVSAITDEKSVDFVPFPEMTGGKNEARMIYGLGCGTFYMSTKAGYDSNQREAALKLLRYLTSKSTATILAERTGMLSNVDIYEFNIRYSRLANKGISMTNKFSQLIGPPDSYLPRTAWDNVIVKDFPYMLENKISPEELWKKALTETQD